MTSLTLTVDTRDASDTLTTIGERLQSGTRTWLMQFRQYMNAQTTTTFAALAHGGTFRGVTWPPFRRTPSARRGGAAARLLDFTGALKSDATRGGDVTADTIEWRMTVPYAAAQHAKRPFLFFNIPTDTEKARTLALNFLRGGA